MWFRQRIRANVNADIIAVKGGALKQIDLLRSPALIIKHGQRYK
jgi:hypothetical protein